MGTAVATVRLRTCRKCLALACVKQAGNVTEQSNAKVWNVVKMINCSETNV